MTALLAITAIVSVTLIITGSIGAARKAEPVEPAFASCTNGRDTADALKAHR